MGFYAIGTIAQRLGQPIHRIKYVIQSRGIKPAGRAGIARVFTEDDVRAIGEEIRRIDARTADGALAR